MNLVYLTDFDIPAPTASSVQVMKMCEAFALLGHQVTLVCLTDKKQSKENIFEYYGVKASFTVKGVYVPRTKGRLYFFALKIIPIAKTLQPDLIFSRSILALVGIAHRFNFIFEAHKPVWEYGFVYDWSFKRIIKSSGYKGLVVISDALRKIFLKKFPTLAITAAHDAANKETCGEAIKVSWAPFKLHVGYTGSIFKGRGIELIVSVANQMPEVAFHIVGGEVADLRKLKIENIPSNLFCHGHVAPSLVSCYRAKFDILLAPYQENVETIGGSLTKDYMSPLKIFEYMSEGKPIISSSFDVIKEVLNDKTAILVPAHNVDAWRNAIIRASDSKVARELGTAAQIEFETHYTYLARAQRILNEIDF